MYERFYYYSRNESPTGSFPGGGTSPVAFLDAAASQNGSFTHSYTVSAGTDRALVVGVQYEAGVDPTTVTAAYGGQSMTRVVEDFAFDGGGGGSNLNCILFVLGESGIASASGSNIVISGLSGTTNITTHARSVESVNQSTLADIFDSAVATAATPNPIVDCDVTCPADGVVIALAGSGALSTASWANLTERTEQATGNSSAMGSLADALDSGATSCDCTWSSQNRACTVALALGPAAGGGEPPPASDFTDLMVSLAPTAWWRLGQSSGNAIDSSGNGHDLSASGSISYGVAGISPDGDAACSFAANSVFFTGDHPDFDFGTGPFTIMFAMKHADGWAGATDQAILGHDGLGNPGQWVVRMDASVDGRMEMSLIDATSGSDFVQWSTTPNSLDDDQWHLVVISSDRTTATLYVDGSAVSYTDSESGFDLTNAQNLYLGARYTNGSHQYTGALDEVAIWKGTALSSTQVQAIATALEL